MAIKVGTCGWSLKGGKNTYYRSFEVVELQSTFYRPLSPRLVERYRREAPAGFEFVVKAWQAITHPVSSPTWRKSATIPEFGDPQRFGLLRPTQENFRAWALVLETCGILRSRFVVVQTPPSFRCDETNKSNMSLFFNSIDRKGIIIGWEPRGDWNRNPGEIKKLCEDLSLIHIVDPFRHLPVSVSGGSGSAVYFRLHGIGTGDTNYGYKYTEEDLCWLASKVSEYARFDNVYVMFNNVHMGCDALRFKRALLQPTPSRG